MIHQRSTASSWCFTSFRKTGFTSLIVPLWIYRHRARTLTMQSGTSTSVSNFISNAVLRTARSMTTCWRMAGKSVKIALCRQNFQCWWGSLKWKNLWEAIWALKELSHLRDSLLSHEKIIQSDSSGIPSGTHGSRTSPTENKGRSRGMDEKGNDTPLIFQTHIEPVPEFIVKNAIRDIGITQQEFMDVLGKL